MRSYGQYCSVAKALDVIGDRWTLLIVRELLLRGGCRYTDLKNGLPGIATNLLADRIRELESAGLVRRQEAPPPVATTLVRLTEAGAELEPVVRALGWWGLRYMAGPADTDEFRGHWFAYPVEFFLRDHDPTGPPASIQLRTDADTAVIELSNGAVRVRVGTVTGPDLVLEGRPQLITALLAGQLSVGGVADRGLRISGDATLLDRVLPGNEDAYHGQPQPKTIGERP
ncbi:MAG: winged helix-turn-helix transcriptional regulator [Trebonia sp.]